IVLVLIGGVARPRPDVSHWVPENGPRAGENQYYQANARPLIAHAKSPKALHTRPRHTGASISFRKWGMNTKQHGMGPNAHAVVSHAAAGVMGAVQTLYDPRRRSQAARVDRD